MILSPKGNCLQINIPTAEYYIPDLGRQLPRSVIIGTPVADLADNYTLFEVVESSGVRTKFVLKSIAIRKFFDLWQQQPEPAFSLLEENLISTEEWTRMDFAEKEYYVREGHIYLTHETCFVRKKGQQQLLSDYNQKVQRLLNEGHFGIFRAYKEPVLNE